MISRRRFLRATLASAAAAAVTGLYTWQVEPHWLELVHRPLPIRGLPDELAGRSLIHLSDIHVGLRVSDDYVRHTFRRVRELAPDLVVFTGDYTSWHPEVLDQIRAIYDEVPHGRLATVGILGNHDYGPGWRYPQIASDIAGALGGKGVRILRNQTQEVEGLTIAGLDDLWAGRFAPEAILPSLRPGAPSLVLSHNPDTLDLSGWGGYEGWVLAGHTHGGQCKPPFLPPPILPVRNPRYTAGEIDAGFGRRVYISRGVGHLTQVRFNVRPEVTVFELRDPETA